MSTKKKYNKWINSQIYLEIYNKYKELALNVYEWEGLPKHLNSRIIEEFLFENGMISFFEYDGMGLIALKCTPGADKNILNQPLNYIATGFNDQITLGSDECIIVRNNTLATPTDQTIRKYAKRLYDIERTIDVNVNGQKTPNIIACNDKTILTMKNIQDQVDEYNMAIMVDKDFSFEDNIKIYPTIAPYVADKLTDLKHDIENELLTRLGINNANTDKRERLIKDEVNSNNEYVDANANIGFKQRTEACELINEMFGSNISVKLAIGGASNEQIHIDDQTDPGE